LTALNFYPLSIEHPSPEKSRKLISNQIVKNRVDLQWAKIFQKLQTT
jgi:hypothetical protein